MEAAMTGGAEVVELNVGGRRFSTSRQTLTWVPDSFFSSLLSGRISTLRDETGAIFIDRDPTVFAPILNFLRTKELDLRDVSPSLLLHEAQFYGITPLVRRLQLREELDRSSCGSVLFNGYLPPPALPAKRRSRPGAPSPRPPSDRPAAIRRSHTVPPMLPHTALPGRPLEDRAAPPSGGDAGMVRIVCGHHHWIAVAYAQFLVCYRLKETSGWQQTFSSPRLDWLIERVALNAKVLGGPLGDHDKMVAAASCSEIILWALRADGNGSEIGVFHLGVPLEALFFVGNQLIATSHTGKIGVWNAVTKHWQVQDVVPINSYDAAGTFLLLGCNNGSIYYVDVQKFPLRMKDNDLLVTELYRDPSEDAVTALSVYLTPKSSDSGNWIEIAYGTSSGVVRVIVQHPETVGSGPQLFQTFTVHRSPVTKIMLSEKHLISVCADNNHVRTWTVTRFRGMISTQPGSTPLASFKVLALEDLDGHAGCAAGTDIGPFGERDDQQVFIQKVVPDACQVYVRLSSTGKRVCEVRAVDGSAITAFTVHECEGSRRVGSRPRRRLLTGHANGSLQLWDLSTAMEMGGRPQEPGVPSPQELLQQLEHCDLLGPTAPPGPPTDPPSAPTALMPPPPPRETPPLRRGGTPPPPGAGGGEERHRRAGERGERGGGVRLRLCPLLCRNGGVCARPDSCLCPPGFTGKFCHLRAPPGVTPGPPLLRRRPPPPPGTPGRSAAPQPLRLHTAHRQPPHRARRRSVRGDGPRPPPPDASITIHRVERLRDDDDDGDPEGGGGGGGTTPKGGAAPGRGGDFGPPPRVLAQNRPQLPGERNGFGPTAGFGYCFNSVTDGECSSPLPGLRTQHVCCRGGGAAWGVHECQPCNPGDAPAVEPCPKGFRRANGSCVDVDECREGGLCQNGVCSNSPGSFACLCHEGFILDSSRSSCISHQVLSEAKAPCFRVLRDGRCALPTLRNITRQICCCSRVGKAWGRDCLRCPPYGSEGFHEICPAGAGYHYSASDLRYNARPLGALLPRVPLSRPRATARPHGVSQRRPPQLPPSRPPPITRMSPPVTQLPPRVPEVPPRVLEVPPPGPEVVIVPRPTQGLQGPPPTPLPAGVCERNPQLCGPGRCVPRGGGYTCVCHNGFWLSTQGTHCIDVDECRRSPLPCSHGAVRTRWAASAASATPGTDPAAPAPTAMVRTGGGRGGIVGPASCRRSCRFLLRCLAPASPVSHPIWRRARLRLQLVVAVNAPAREQMTLWILRNISKVFSPLPCRGRLSSIPSGSSIYSACTCWDGNWGLLFFPFLHQDWQVHYQQDGPVAPRFDVNAPDLYIPAMAFITYLLVAGLALGTQNRWGSWGGPHIPMGVLGGSPYPYGSYGRSHPDSLGLQASFRPAWLLLEVLAVLLRQGLYPLFSEWIACGWLAGLLFWELWGIRAPCWAGAALSIFVFMFLISAPLFNPPPLRPPY
eukprot:XP_025000233.1 uncharacterized protein LOC107050762 [Gallus gallus]